MSVQTAVEVLGDRIKSTDCSSAFVAAQSIVLSPPNKEIKPVIPAADATRVGTCEKIRIAPAPE